MRKSNEDIRAKNLARARRQVEHWKEEEARNQKELAELKEKVQAGYDRGKSIATNLADALEYLQDLENEPNT